MRMHLPHFSNEIIVEENPPHPLLHFPRIPPRLPPDQCSSNSSSTFIFRMNSANRNHSLSDPITAALLPPPNESAADREKRLRAEEQAKKISDDIDEMLKAERNERRKKNPVKVLLLGQSESGKSTTLKQFQLLHTPAAFNAERIAWRFVIYLNLVRSIRRILDAISPDYETLNSHILGDDEDENADAASLIISSTDGTSSSSYHGIRGYENYQHRLAPLLVLEQRLIALLSDEEDNEEREATRLITTWSASSPSPGSVRSPKAPPDLSASLEVIIPQNVVQPGPNSPLSPQSTQEISVKTTSNWKKALSLGGRMKSPKSPHSGELAGWWEDPDDPVHILNRCSPAMLDLWKDPNVQQRLVDKRLRLEESSGFYLEEISRITAKKYIPTDVDVLKARLKTTGVVEHTFAFKTAEFRGMTWKIYDVGGSKNQRHAWAPFFDDVNAIIFLAPISTFDQVLAEDPHVNRLEDSLLLWKSIVSNRLLSNVSIILFLNKCDLLQAKLDAGVRLNQHMVSYGDRPNDYDSISNYFRNKFGALHQSYTPNRERELYIHLTSVTDTRRTHTIISSVRDFILKSNLKMGGYM
ncbi:guanine nucleotide binding protein, alpha subunit [Thelephora terrestris]|uniref:Guanine nucleotide binding protein, alpha subunit n=1 Tax=Thelephora terrestris TaxID=56493 RepID=A0A9P6L0S6_9AGAM|nr:guanine nucleotide binding protein, alpha subunit [Thelephora terrestris]